MLEYRIPVARIISVAVIGVCFFIALIVMNMQATGRSRTFGLLGVILILASTFLQAATDRRPVCTGRTPLLTQGA